VPRLVTSLWQVDDLATAELMRRFYRGLIVHQLSPAAALRHAQREMRANPRWQSPFYWAAFTLVGDWQ
jgi:CHAT domain-containing protein